MTHYRDSLGGWWTHFQTGPEDALAASFHYLTPYRSRSLYYSNAASSGFEASAFEIPAGYKESK